MHKAVGLRSHRLARLASDGGPAVRKVDFPEWPRFYPDDIEAVADVLRSGRVNYWIGDEGRQFEAEFAALYRHEIRRCRRKRNRGVGIGAACAWR